MKSPSKKKSHMQRLNKDILNIIYLKSGRKFNKESKEYIKILIRDNDIKVEILINEFIQKIYTFQI